MKRVVRRYIQSTAPAITSYAALEIRAIQSPKSVATENQSRGTLCRDHRISIPAYAIEQQ
jgi:hypothetical protein